MAKNMTLKNVAAKAGVSVSTAAAAIRRDPCVRPVTAQKVLYVSAAMGYRRNSAAAAMASLNVRSVHKQVKIAVLTGPDPAVPPRQDSGRRTGPSPSPSAAEKLGVQCLHLNLERPDDLHRMLQSIENRGCDGIVLDNIPFPLADLPEWCRFSLISTQETPGQRPVDVVRSCQFRTTLKLLRRLQGSGFRRIGFFHRRHPQLTRDDEERFGAFTAFSRYEVKPKNRIPVIEAAFGERDVESGVLDWYKTHRPEVIVGFSIQDSRILTDAGISIPDGVEWVCLHVEENHRGAAAGLQSNRELAPEYAVRLLMEKVLRGARGFSEHPTETDVSPALLAGDSCPRLQADDHF